MTHNVQLKFERVWLQEQRYFDGKAIVFGIDIPQRLTQPNAVFVMLRVVAEIEFVADGHLVLCRSVVNCVEIEARIKVGEVDVHSRIDCCLLIFELRLCHS